MIKEPGIFVKYRVFIREDSKNGMDILHIREFTGIQHLCAKRQKN